VSTSIRDLLTAATHELDAARAAEGSTASDITVAVSIGVQALTAISAAAPILAMLSSDAVHAEPYGIYGHAVTALATATRNVATASRGLPDTRAAQLLGAAGDVIGTLRHDLGRDERWALALAVADTVRRASTLYNTAGPSAPNRHVDWSRRAAVLLAHLGAERPPDPHRLSIHDRPIPDPIVGRPATTLAAAAQAVDNMSHLLHRPTGASALYQLRATAAVAETAARYLAALAAAADLYRDDGWDRVPQSWSHVRRELGVFHEGQLLRRDSGDRLLDWAARAHDALVRALGPADQINSNTVAALSAPDHTHLIQVAHQLPTIANTLRAQLSGLDGRVFARIADLPRQERRITEQIRAVPVVADGPDFGPAHTSLRRAEVLSTRLAAELPDRIAVNAEQARLAHHPVDREPTQPAAPARRLRLERGAHPGPHRELSPPPGR
jgi:hypothetical protein